MHRTFDIAVPAELTTRLIDQLRPLEAVIGLSLDKGASLKPEGDIVTVQLLNRGGDEVLKRIQAICGGTDYAVATAEQTSLIAPRQQTLVENDYDEAVWEEMETGLRHNGHVTSNYLALMGIGGVVAAVGLVSKPSPQAVAFVAAAVIAPGFDPLAKIALGLLLRKPGLIRLGVWSTLTGYSLLVLMAAGAFWFMRLTGAATIADFTGNDEVSHLAEPTSRELLMSVCGSLAGGIIVASYRESFIAGALMALAFIHAAAMIGVGLAAGEWAYALEGLERFALDMGLIVGGCWLVFAVKQVTLHRRKPIV